MSNIQICNWCKYYRKDPCKPEIVLHFCDNPKNESGMVTKSDYRTIVKLGCAICSLTDEAIERSKIYYKGGYKGGI